MGKNQKFRGIRQYLVTFVVCWSLVVFLPFVDRFGIKYRLQADSYDIYNRIFGINYPYSYGLPTRRDNCDKCGVAVVLADEDSLAMLAGDRQRAWPAPARFYAALLEALLRFEPEAVLIDVLFLDDFVARSADEGHRGLEALSLTLEKYEQRGIKILLPGAPAMAAGRLTSSRSLLPELEERLTIGASRWPVSEDVWLLKKRFGNIEIVSAASSVDGPEHSLDDPIIRAYPLTGKVHASSVDAIDAQMKSAAVRLYELAMRDERPAESWQHAPDLFLLWNLRVPDGNRQWMACSSTSADRTSLSYRFLTAALHPGELKQSCATIPTVPLIDLMLPGNDEEVEAELTGRLVLFGTDIVSGDHFSTAVSESVPGVFVHAMAVENLLAYGSDYLKREAHWGPFHVEESSTKALIGATSVSLIVLAFLRFSRRREEGPEKSDAGEKGWAWERLPGVISLILVELTVIGVATLLATFALSTLLVEFTSLPPLNWLYFPLLAVFAYEFLELTNLDWRLGAWILPWSRFLQKSEKA